jgi:hypothetical protein
MRHFFAKNTVEAQIYCKKCCKETLWKVAGGRPLYCTACYGDVLLEIANPPLDLVGAK